MKTFIKAPLPTWLGEDTPEKRERLQRLASGNPEGLNPSIHCSLTRGIAAPKNPLDFNPESAVE
jgi:hypothetical protein